MESSPDPKTNPVEQLLPLNGIGPTPLNLTPNQGITTDNHDNNNNKTNTSSAFIAPAPFTPKDPANPPTFHAVQPDDLQQPIPLSPRLPIVYDAATQEYWIFTTSGALRLHQTPRITISKKEARKLLSDFPARDKAVDDLTRRFHIPKSPDPSFLPDELIVYNALHDSIIVERVQQSSSLFVFFEDKKVKPPHEMSIPPAYFGWLRPRFDNLAGHQCRSLYHCGNNVVYCADCTAYHIPISTANNTIHFGQKLLLGRVTMPARVAAALLAQCLLPTTTTLDWPRAYTVLACCFPLTPFTAVPIPQSWLLMNLLRDSLLVEHQGQRHNWATYFQMSGQVPGATAEAEATKAQSAAAGAKLVGAGVSLGLGIASLLLG